MDNAVKTRLQSIQLGEPQTYKNISILPLIASADGTFQYRTLGEALASWDIAITEVSAAGSVPDLLVVNRANKPVLLIDGEELAGAKQNRVLNTSILIKEVSETKIPVSCTEQGRWSYASKAFSESGNVMTYRSRSRKTRSVQRSLESSGAAMSDQGEVWAGVAELQAKACCMSPTSAMSDVYKACEEDLRACDEVFKPIRNQVGILTIIDGHPAGLDMISLTAAYAKIHSKLARSYILEGLLDAAKPGEQGSTAGLRPATFSLQPSTVARAFLDEILSAEELQFATIGYGTDYRYKACALIGSVLVHANEVVHAAFFRIDQREQRDTMSLYRRRRHHYRE